MANIRTEVAIIGGGPGGYVAALRLGQLGKKTLLIEKNKLGGTCLNVGCIPSKALISMAGFVGKIKTAERYGIMVSGLEVDFKKMQQWKQSVVDKLVGGIAYLCKGQKVEVLNGEARFRSPRQLEVRKKDGAVDLIEADNVIIATGSEPAELRDFPRDGELIIDSTDALELQEIPKSLAIIGGGYIGLELGQMYAALGAKVTVVEMLDQLLPGFDPELVRVIGQSLRRLGASFHVKARAKGVEKRPGGIALVVDSGGKETKIEADKLLVTVGRRPVTRNLGLGEIGLATDRQGFVRVDDKLRTGIDSVYAIGDVVGNPMLAHKAFKEGEVAAEVIAGKASVLEYRAMPAVVFTHPELATVGLSEAEAREQGRQVITGRFPFAASGRALGTGEAEGFVKVVADAGSHQVLGVQIVGPEASTLISEAALAIEMGAAVEDIGLTIHPHPTLGEALMEAARAAIGEAIHVLSR